MKTQLEEMGRNKRTVFYGICGEGLGHFSRAAYLIPELLEAGYEVEIFTSGRVAELCRQRFPDCSVHPIPGFRMDYQSNSLNIMGTFLCNSMFLAKGAIKAFSLAALARKLQPVAAISDYEPVVAWTACTSGIPLITVDHQQVFSECHTLPLDTKRFNKLLLRFSNTMTYLRPDVQIITSFFKPPLKRRRRNKVVQLIGPILRPELFHITPENGQHIVVYQTSRSLDWLDKILELIPGEKRVYGTGKNQSGQEERPFSEETFLKDLASCRFAIVNGGHTTISEALYFGKPLICIPVRGQGEQEMNARYVETLGYGMNFQLKHGELPEVLHFFAKEEEFRDKINGIQRKCGNKALKDMVLHTLSGSDTPFPR